MAGFSVVSPDPPSSARLYAQGFGLPLEGEGGYLSTNQLDGLKHFGVWPLQAAAEACFGTSQWPASVRIPQATIEFEVKDPAAVEAAVAELEAGGHELLHPARMQPWGQTVARLLSPEGLLIGVTYTPWMHPAD